MIDRHARCAIGPLVACPTAVSFALVSCTSPITATTSAAQAGACTIASAGVAGIDSVALYAKNCASGDE